MFKSGVAVPLGLISTPGTADARILSRARGLADTIAALVGIFIGGLIWWILLIVALLLLRRYVRGRIAKT